MSSILGQIVLTAAAAGCLVYFFANQSSFEMKKEKRSILEKIGNQVSFRDPKLIEEHKKKLEEENKKLLEGKTKK